jgi:hypothetical protein
MDAAAQHEGQDPLVDRPIRAGAAFEGSAEIAEAWDMARDFLTSVQAVHGLPVSARAMGTVHGSRKNTSRSTTWWPTANGCRPAIRSAGRSWSGHSR